MKRALIPSLLYLILSAGVASADIASLSPEPATFAQLDARLTADCEAGRFSGVVVARKATEIVFQHVCGLADIATSKPIRLDTRFKIFSVSKSLTGTLIMILADHQLVALDDPARKYVPDMPEEWSGITIRQLLNHTSGIPDLTEKLLDAYEGNPSGGYDDAMHSVLAGISTEEKQFGGNPGTKFVYNNFGYELLALLIENVSHASYEQVITQKIFEPAQMDTAEIAKPSVLDGKLVGSQLSPGLAQGYNGKPGMLNPANSFQFVQMGAGAVYASAQDMLNFDSALFDGKLVSKEMVEECSAHAIMVLPNPNPVSYGCGWMNRKVGGEPYFQHDGGTNGFVADFARDPRENVAVVIMSNFGFADTRSIRNALMALILKPSSQIY